MTIIGGKKVLTDASGAPLNPEDKKPVADMSANAIERRENVQTTKDMMQSAMDDYVKTINPMLSTKPQKLSEYLCFHNMVLCKPHVIRNESVGGILFTEEMQGQQQKAINDALGFEVVKVGPEVVNARVGDFVFQGSPSRPMIIPLIDDTGDDIIVRHYHSFAENWLCGALRENGNQDDVKPSPMPEHEVLSAK